MMSADDFRQLYDYHFAANRKIWEECVVRLTQEQFVQKVDYSVGSVRNQVVHMLNIDDRWFSGLRGEPVPGFLNVVYFSKRDKIRVMWDEVEDKMRDYLATLTDDMLPLKAFPDEEKDNMLLWQVLFHVANHGTDHRAQLLALLYHLGVKTFPQDFVFFLNDKL